MSLGEIAGLVAAFAALLLVCLCAVPLIKLGRVLDELRQGVHDVSAESVPILTELKGTVSATNTELEKLSVVTEDAARLSGNASVIAENAAQLSNLLAATLGGPLVRAAALAHGVRKALGGSRGGSQ